MPTLTVNGQKVRVGDEFLSLSPEDQDATVDEIASSLGGKSVGGFFSNLGSNAAEVGGHLATAVSQPVETAKALGKTVVGMAQQFVPGQQEYETQYADPLYKQIGKDFGFRRGQQGIEWSGQQLADNLYERPVDVALDAAMLAAPLESAPGKVGAVAKAANPINVAAKGVTTVAKTPTKIAKYVTGETSGLGPQAISEAYRSGRVGGVEGAAFRSGMRGDLDPEAPVDVARGAVGKLKQDRAQEYKAGMQSAGVTGNATQLNFQPIETAFNSVAGIKTFRGKTVKPSVESARQKVREALDEWKADPGAWTAEGFDALKQRIQDIGEGLNPMTEGAARTMVGNVAQAIKHEITKQAPDYAKVMKAYERASHAITEVQKSLTGTSKTSVDTSLRRLQSVLRNNAFTNWSARAKLAEIISKKAPELMPMLSGMAANVWTPRGLPGKILGGGGVGAAGYGALGLEPMSLAVLGGAAAAASPRAVGEIAHGAGRLRGAIDSASQVTPQAVKSGAKTAIVAVPRVQSLEHARTVISPKVMEHIKKSANTRGPLNAWLKAREAGQGVEEATLALAQAIANEVQRPELVDRIAQELSQARGP